MDAAQDAPLQAALAAEYDALVRIVAEFDGRLLTIRSWSVTLSLAALGLGFQQQHYALFALGAASGAAFWTIEAMTKWHQARYYPRMRQIEAWSAAMSTAVLGATHISAPRIDSAWTGAGNKLDPGAALSMTPSEMTSEQILRMRRRTPWLPHVLVPSALAFLLGLTLSLLAARGSLDIPL